jgi:hypothetical protein
VLQLEGLKIDAIGLACEEDGSDTSGNEEEPLDTTAAHDGPARAPIERHAFLFRHSSGLSRADVRQLHPATLEVPFLLDAFSENVNMLCRVVQMSEVTQLARDIRKSGTDDLSPSQEALLFSIYYAAITSMEAEDVGSPFP